MTKLEDIPFQKPKNGYAPAEDSWLLVQTVQDYAQNIRGKKCLDMGCGSGIQTAAMLLHQAKEVVCADINPHALPATQKMVEKYFPNTDVKYVESDLFARINEQFDIIVFNPPYVPSDEIKWVETDGGESGRAVIDRFLDQFPPYLKKNGECYLLQSSLNGIQTTTRKIEKMGMKAKITAKQKLAFEELIVLKIQFIQP